MFTIEYTRKQPASVNDIIRGLKHAKRRGWLLSGISPTEAESTYLHSHRLRKSLQLLAQTRTELDLQWVDTRARWHDLSDYCLADITPSDKIPDADKHALEWEAVRWMTATLGHTGENLRTYWLDANTGDSVQRSLLHQMDKIEPCIEALRLMHTNRDPKIAQYPLTRFYPYALPQIKDGMLGDILGILHESKYAVDARTQYCALLQLRGDRQKFDQQMRSL